MHSLLAETDEEAVAEAKLAWAAYRWNLGSPRRLEAEKRGLTQFLGANMGRRPATAPAREVRRDLFASIERSEEQEHRRMNPGGISSLVVAGSPAAMRAYLDEYRETGANYFVCSFQWGDLTHEQAMRSIELFTTEVMPYYV
jgi:alkanesulfonate monooxygenase SsuD/methylene tetrahydromethanopterin reductase-like flavin-dependent oxidoreductase (luciferase family)